MEARRAALGFKAHTGWATVVALAGPLASPRVIAKRRITLAERFDDGALYHVGQGLPLADAERLIRSSRTAFEGAARDAIEKLVAELRAAGCEPAASAVVSGDGRPLPALGAILRSHALVHAAEGELYRSVFARASEACGLPAALVPAKELSPRAARALGIATAQVASTLAALGRSSGRPWARDQKEAALAACIALPGRRGARG